MWLNTFFQFIASLHKQAWCECLSAMRCNKNEKKILCQFFDVSTALLSKNWGPQAVTSHL